jgi:hypothetical protein
MSEKTTPIEAATRAIWEHDNGHTTWARRDPFEADPGSAIAGITAALDAVDLDAVQVAHEMTEHHAGNGYSEPRESWIVCACGEDIWSWQQFYAETDVDPNDAMRAHLTAALRAALLEGSDR